MRRSQVALARRALSALGARPYYALAHPPREARRARIREELMRSQFLSLEELEALQVQRLRRQLARAVAVSPWYRERLRDAPPPARFTLADLRHVPVLEKQDLQERLDEITGPPQPEWFLESSSGSTGHPVRVYHTREHFSAINAGLERDYTMCGGYRLHERRAYLWGAPEFRSGHLFVRDALMSRLRLSGVALDDRSASETVAELRAFAPRLLIGYVSMLREVARELDRPLSSLRAVQSSAETLTDEDRSFIEEGIGAPVYNRYGAREVGNIAHECDQHGGMHLAMESNIVEVVDGDGQPLTDPGAEGDLVVTSLTNGATHLIRYRLGDIARVGARSCRCGRGSAKLEAVLGRDSEVILSPGGKRLMSRFFSQLFFGEPVRQFRVEQLTATDLRVLVVPAPGYSDEVRDRLVRRILETGDPRFLVEWTPVTSLDTTSTGKFLFITSRIAGRERGQ